MNRIVLLLALFAALLLAGAVACGGGDDSGNGAAGNGAADESSGAAATTPPQETATSAPTAAAAAGAVAPVSASESTPTPTISLAATPTMPGGSSATPPPGMTAVPDGTPVAPLAALPAEAAYGDYAVGTVTGFAVDNRQRFDPWNTAYASPPYREFLRRVEASGQRRTVIFQLWYPAVADTASGRLAGPRSVYPAADGDRASFMDFYFQDEALQRQLAGGVLQISPETLYVEGGRTLAELDQAEQMAAYMSLGGQVLSAPQSAWMNAAPAEGDFPVIVLSHGLGGAHSMWGTLAEFLVSHGYIVAAPSFISDSSTPLVFHDEDSPFAAQSTPEEVQQAYNLLLGEFKVIPSFYRLMFGVDVSGGFGALQNFNPAEAQVVPGGVERATTMMRNLFRQRVADAGLVLHTVRLLGEEAGACRAALEGMGATSAARQLCGLLTGRVDGQRAGLAGHSLGSMTSQLGANHLPGVRAALGFNNGVPFTWTPEEIYGGGQTADGLPAGSRLPTLQMIGDEDAFVQGVFINLFQTAVAQAGGDPADAFPLEAERALPDRAENPQPVALSGWQRSTGDRSLVIVRDVNHGTLVDEFARNFSWLEYQQGNVPFAAAPRGVRKSTGADAFQPAPPPGEEFALLDWAELGDGSPAYLPHLIRDWYARAWFDWYLKGDEAARQRLQSPDPFGALTHARTEVQ